ncbi:TnsA endonuclease N-terminal domain-containing protein [Silvimonas iriomotensis]|uniref:TnsA endonuclease N-terminal domain-containing protein n=1 Tax=Silvimonas iriomotensis TaxID=449662 RepID=A0ABQ2PCF1_9NEIS|nr:TnsA endonuclease N-terminal domain-containing protein [Silvimonas iriomotensis]GGP22889.1 hypothetical protein GCM10010970_28890 [Silvimonas iriomotensis]
MSRLVSKRSVRRIGKSYRSVTGYAPTGFGHIPYESTLERDFVTLAEILPGVTDILSQPVQVRYAVGKVYTPDYKVSFADGSYWLVEIKYRKDLKEDWEAFRPGFKAAVHQARLEGGRFRILTEVEIRSSALLENATFLKDYRSRREEPNYEQRMMRMLEELGETTPRILLEACFESDHHFASAVGYLWRLMAVGLIRADLTQPLNMKSPIWLGRSPELHDE